jgi:hypothetical protein
MSLAARKFRVIDPNNLSDTALLADAAAEVARTVKVSSSPFPSNEEGKAKLRQRAEERAQRKAEEKRRIDRIAAKPFLLDGVVLPSPSPITRASAIAFLTAINLGSQAAWLPDSDGVKHRVVRREGASVLDVILAIARFVGYDRFASFGAQEVSARFAAIAALRPCTLVRMPRVPLSIAGYIAGMPNEDRKVYLDLVARESLAANAIQDCEAILAHTQVSPEVASELRAEAREYHDALGEIKRALADFHAACGESFEG